MRRKIILYGMLALMVIALLLGIGTNYFCIKENIVQQNYHKNNGRLLIYGLASTFAAWGNDVDDSIGYQISKKCIDNLGYLDSGEFSKNLEMASSDNIILNKKNLNISGKKSININQCIILSDIKVLYLTYNTLFPNTDKIITIKLMDHNGNIIAEEPSFIDITEGSLMTNYENYFWGIDYPKLQKLILHIEVNSAQGELLYEYDQILY